MKKALLSIYLNDSCNLNCKYCNANYDIKPSIKEEDIQEFILQNSNNIDFSQIQLLGGEPSIIYTDKFLNFLYEKFENITITSNLKDIKKLKNMVEILQEKCHISASFNLEIADEFFQNANDLEKYIHRFSIVVTKDNLSNLYKNISLLSKYNKPILLSPEDDKNCIGYVFNKAIFVEQLKKIFEDKLEKLLVNFQKIEQNRKTDLRHCNETILLITKAGNLESCSHATSIYKSDKEYSFGTIFDTKIKDIEVTYPEIENISYDGTNCNECKKCHNYACYPRVYGSTNGKIQEQVCEFHKAFYDFATNYKYFPNLTGITVFMTEQCNMKCTYCFEKDFKNRIGNISNETIKRSLDMLFKIDDGTQKKYTFFGGEPSLNIEGIRFALNYYKELKRNGLKSTLYFDINTNLLVLSDELIELFKDIREETFLYMSVSLDGFKELNDKQRIDINNKGTYDKIINNVIKLKKELSRLESNCTCPNVKICKHTVLQNENILFIDKIVEEAWKQKDIFDEFSLAYVTASKGEHTGLTYENLEYINNYYNNVKKLILDKKKKNFILEYINFLNVDEDILNNDGYAICNVINSILSIRANGDIMPCHAFLDMIEIEKYETDIKIDNILEIDLDSFGINMQSKWYPLLDKEERLNNGTLIMESELGYECRLCPFKFMCHTCIASLHEIKGNKIIKSKELCMRTLNQAEILLKIKEIKALKELDELSELENTKIDNLLQGLLEVGNLVVDNKGKLDYILNAINCDVIKNDKGE